MNWFKSKDYLSKDNKIKIVNNFILEYEKVGNITLLSDDMQGFYQKYFITPSYTQDGLIKALDKFKGSIRFMGG